MTTALTASAPVLDLVGGQHHAANASTLCGAALWGRLTDSSAKADEVVRQIARVPKLKDKAVEVAADLEARAVKATAIEIMAVLIEHGPVYGIRDLSDGEYEALFMAYLRSLAPLPIEAIREAFVIWGRDGNGFFPRPEQLFQRAEPYATDLRMAAYRAKRAATHVEDNPPPKTEAQRRADIEAAKAAGIIGADGKVILNFKTDETRRVGPPGETRQAMADRLRRIANGEEPLPEVSAPPAPPPEEIEEAI